MKNTGKRYNDEIKTDIIYLIQEDKWPVSSIIKDFDISGQTVRNWLKSNKDSKEPDKVRIAELESELKETKRKLADT